MLKLFVVTILFVAIAVILLGVGIFFFHRKFPNTHVGGNVALRNKGIYCVQTQDMMEWKGIKPKRKTERKEKEVVTEEEVQN